MPRGAGAFLAARGQQSATRSGHFSCTSGGGPIFALRGQNYGGRYYGQHGGRSAFTIVAEEGDQTRSRNMGSGPRFAYLSAHGRTRAREFCSVGTESGFLYRIALAKHNPTYTAMAAKIRRFPSSACHLAATRRHGRFLSSSG